ncbi:MAG: hypothetical protein LBQ59_00405 [Candidatus Peribacteria bacterium]|nr:hypothetical protein [Candidatus Peribacteria bacterium]
MFIALLFPVLAKIDPKNKNYKKFQKTWEIFQFAIIGFFAYFYFVSIYVILHPEANISTFIIL